MMDTVQKAKILKTAKYSKQTRRKRRQEIINNIIVVANDYSSASTIHGISYIGNRDHSNCGRVFWILTVLIALGCTIFQVSNIWNQWFDNPVLTNLDTISFPAERIDFPAITLCPQGSTKDVMDSFLYNQFEEWLSQKSDKDGLKINRNKRQVEKGNCECHVPYLGNLTIDDLQCCFRQFFDELFPGVYPNNPTKIASTMFADDPAKAIANEAIMLPDEEPKCNDKDGLDILNNLNEKLQQKCPNLFQKFNDSTCVISNPLETTYNEALKYCKENYGANVFFHELLEDVDALDKIFGKWSNDK